MLHLCKTSQWRHNERDSVSNHRCLDCLLNHLFRGRSKKTPKLRATGLCDGNAPVTSQRASNAEDVSIWWRHNGMMSPILAYSTQAVGAIDFYKSSWWLQMPWHQVGVSYCHHHDDKAHSICLHLYLSSLAILAYSYHETCTSPLPLKPALLPMAWHKVGTRASQVGVRVFEAIMMTTTCTASYDSRLFNSFPPPRTKLPPYCRRHIQTHLLEWKSSSFDKKSLKCDPKGPIDWW